MRIDRNRTNETAVSHTDTDTKRANAHKHKFKHYLVQSHKHIHTNSFTYCFPRPSFDSLLNCLSPSSMNYTYIHVKWSFGKFPIVIPLAEETDNRTQVSHRRTPTKFTDRKKPKLTAKKHENGELLAAVRIDRCCGSKTY